MNAERAAPRTWKTDSEIALKHIEDALGYVGKQVPSKAGDKADRLMDAWDALTLASRALTSWAKAAGELTPQHNDGS